MAKVKKLVVDSSVMVKWVNSQDESYLDQSNRLLDDCNEGKVVLVAPELAKYEVGNVLWKKGLTLPAAQASLGTIYGGPVEFMKQDEAEAMLAMEIATKSGVTFYDATFISLAVKLGATLVTDNPKHQHRFEGVRVIALKDYIHPQ